MSLLQVLSGHSGCFSLRLGNHTLDLADDALSELFLSLGVLLLCCFHDIILKLQFLDILIHDPVQLRVESNPFIPHVSKQHQLLLALRLQIWDPLLQEVAVLRKHLEIGHVVDILSDHGLEPHRNMLEYKLSEYVGLLLIERESLDGLMKRDIQVMQTLVEYRLV